MILPIPETIAFYSIRSLFIVVLLAVACKFKTFLGDPLLGDPFLGDPFLGDPLLGDPKEILGTR